MTKKKEEFYGRLFMIISLIGAVIILGLSMLTQTSSIKSDILFVVTVICVAIGSFRAKVKYPIYYKYQLLGCVIILTSFLVSKFLG